MPKTPEFQANFHIFSNGLAMLVALFRLWFGWGMREHDVCPLSKAGHMARPARRLLHNPAWILGGLVRPGMTVLDVGCGPGFFAMEAARLVGPGGHVIAADLQQGMLDMLSARLAGGPYERRVTLHACAKDRVGVDGPVDAVLAFFVVHEVPDKRAFFDEMRGILRPGGVMLVAEPPHHVDAAEFAEMLEIARSAGFRAGRAPFMLAARRVLLTAV